MTHRDADPHLLHDTKVWSSFHGHVLDGRERGLFADLRLSTGNGGKHGTCSVSDTATTNKQQAALPSVHDNSFPLIFFASRM